MADSYRLVVLRALCDHLKGITEENGFDYDLSQAVFRGRLAFGDSDPIPMVSVVESTKPENVSTAANGLERRADWALIVQGWVKNDPFNPCDEAYQLMAAVEKQLGKIVEVNRFTGDGKYPDSYLLGSGGSMGNNLIAGFKYGPGVVSPPREQVSSNAFFFLPVWITLAETPGQPYFVP